MISDHIQVQQLPFSVPFLLLKTYRRTSLLYARLAQIKLAEEFPLFGHRQSLH
jgi:hypothetical protein